ncbi:TonB family protein [Lysobacter capsici]|uniref:TonB family protein n=1 Tax=Lysobacter capsici TaxID=435897 RepID=UPI0012FD0B60|nr:TonB family protein [Lysobacter capsici]
MVDQLIRMQATPVVIEAEDLNGFVLLKSVVETDGSVRLTKVGISSGWSMIDDAASSAAAQWKYEPALVDGKPVRSVIEYTLYFGKGSR